MMNESPLGVYQSAAISEFGGYIVNNYSIMINGIVEFKPDKCLILNCRKKPSEYAKEQVIYYGLDLNTGEIVPDNKIISVHCKLLPRNRSTNNNNKSTNK